PDGFLDVLDPWLSPTRTLIDVGAGYGRLTVPLAGRLEWVTAVEPSEAMRDRLPDLENLTVIASEWADAEVQPADLVICVHVLYGVEDAPGFLERLEAAATERVFVVLREGALRHPAELLGEWPRQPRLSDCWNVLRQLGVNADVAYWRTPSIHRYADLEEAVEDCRAMLGKRWQEGPHRDWLAAHLQRDSDGGLYYDAGPSVAGALHWRPRGSEGVPPRGERG
ncbi:MAG: methyltransferase domain-containing protein, partial [Candidatus Dormibacteraeota bacterium]|nr:methyltransferase domain-containing protein [Candidatus Dormibacteraeota bacterium]MBO0761915.1 methyltransferase domain-containing protein [Candidatus Dormibacteraeota bacterium]